MSIDFGFVYFLSNPSMPGMYKIGFTTKHPKARMADLCSSSGCPTPFTLLAYFGTMDPQQIESTLHRYFASSRVNNRREFFSVDLNAISRALDHFTKRSDDAVYRTKLDTLVAGQNSKPPPVIVAEVERERTEEEIEEDRRICKQRFADLKALLVRQT